MADIFSSRNLNGLLRNKTVWFLGDSNMRGLYKDFVWLSQKNTLITQSSLGSKLEKTFMKDRLIQSSALTRDRSFQEVRHFCSADQKTAFQFTFLTCCLTPYLRNMLASICRQPKEAPDIIIINSCLWDISRWGPESVQNYKKNIPELLDILKFSLPPSTLVIWTTTPPLSARPHGGFFIKQIEFTKHTLRFEVMEANMFVRQEVVTHGFDVLDIHFQLLLQIHRRRKDGIHWNPDAVRHMTNLLLTHISLSLGHPLPGNFDSPILDRMVHLTSAPVIPDCKETLKQLDLLLDGPQTQTPNEASKASREKRKKSPTPYHRPSTNTTRGHSKPMPPPPLMSRNWNRHGNTQQWEGQGPNTEQHSRRNDDYPHGHEHTRNSQTKFKNSNEYKYKARRHRPY